MEKQLHMGMRVRGANGTNLGRVVALSEESFLVERGVLAPRDYIATYDDVRETRDDDVYIAADSLRECESLELQVEDSGYFVDAPEPDGSQIVESGTTPSEGGELRIPLAEERVSVEKHMREAGVVRIHKEVITEHRTIVVPVMREEVRVEHVGATSGDAGGVSPRFETTVLTIPVMQEEIEIRKHPVVREEIRVLKAVRYEEQRLSTELRREEAQIEQDRARSER